MAVDRFGKVNPTTGAGGFVQAASAVAGNLPSYATEVVFNLRYPGQQWDDETGLAYNINRYYDKSSGRYIQADPSGLEGGWNRFGYVDADPLSFIDPMGLCSCTDILSQAEALNNDSRYATSQPSRPGPNTNKCNFFVDDFLESTSVAPRRNILGMPISAGTWADPKAIIPNFPVVRNPQPGDVVAVSHRYADASGHVAIVKVPGVSSIGAGATTGSHITGWPWDPSTMPQGNPVYRRCTCQ
jgi:RHS repeat-associated protein